MIDKLSKLLIKSPSALDYDFSGNELDMPAEELEIHCQSLLKKSEVRDRRLLALIKLKYPAAEHKVVFDEDDGSQIKDILPNSTVLEQVT